MKTLVKTLCYSLSWYCTTNILQLHYKDYNTHETTTQLVLCWQRMLQWILPQEQTGQVYSEEKYFLK